MLRAAREFLAPAQGMVAEWKKAARALRSAFLLLHHKCLRFQARVETVWRT